MVCKGESCIVYNFTKHSRQISYMHRKNILNTRNIIKYIILVLKSDSHTIQVAHRELHPFRTYITPPPSLAMIHRSVVVIHKGRISRNHTRILYNSNRIYLTFFYKITHYLPKTMYIPGKYLKQFSATYLQRRQVGTQPKWFFCLTLVGRVKKNSNKNITRVMLQCCNAGFRSTACF